MKEHANWPWLHGRVKNEKKLINDVYCLSVSSKQARNLNHGIHFVHAGNAGRLAQIVGIVGRAVPLLQFIGRVRGNGPEMG